MSGLHLYIKQVKILFKELSKSNKSIEKFSKLWDIQGKIVPYLENQDLVIWDQYPNIPHCKPEGDCEWSLEELHSNAFLLLSAINTLSYCR